jgi:5-methylthioribose kinase
LRFKKFEVEAMTRVKAWLSPDTVVTIPTVYKFDEDSHVLILEDCGEDTLTLKEFAREGKVTMDLAGEIGTAIGQFIGSMHVWSLKNPGGILDIFRRHKQAMALSAWATYGRLMPTLNGEDVLAALSDPPISVSERDVEVVAKLASEMNVAMTSAHEFVSGAPYICIELH